VQLRRPPRDATCKKTQHPWMSNSCVWLARQTLSKGRTVIPNIDVLHRERQHRMRPRGYFIHLRSRLVAPFSALRH
jgi:hypothetical protein